MHYSKSFIIEQIQFFLHFFNTKQQETSKMQDQSLNFSKAIIQLIVAVEGGSFYFPGLVITPYFRLLMLKY